MVSNTILHPLCLVLLGLIYMANCQTIDIGSKRYTIVAGQKRNWYQASHYCAMKGMTLTSIDSEAEYTSLRNYMYNQNRLSDSYWLSGNNLADSAVYSWLSNGNNLQYTPWMTGQPTGTDKCVFTSTDFKWSTETCTKTKYFICSRPLVPKCGITGRCKRSANYFF